MLSCKESDGTLYRTVTVTIKPTPTEIADAIWNLDSDEQVMLLGCLKRRFCDRGEGLMRVADVANTLARISDEKSVEVKAFVRCLADYILGYELGGRKMTEEALKNKCKERAKIFQQAMESCKSSNPMDCVV